MLREFIYETYFTVGRIIVGWFIGYEATKFKSSVNESIDAIDSVNFKVPKVPTSPQGISEFEGDINKFIQDNADKRAQELENSLNR